MSIQIKETEREIRYLKNILAVKHKHKNDLFSHKKRSENNTKFL